MRRPSARALVAIAAAITLLLGAAAVRLVVDDRDADEQTVLSSGGRSRSTESSTSTSTTATTVPSPTSTEVQATTTTVAATTVPTPTPSSVPSEPAPTTSARPVPPKAVVVPTPDAGGVYVAKVDGSELTRVVTGDYLRRKAALSPDNAKVAYGFDRKLALVGIDGNGTAVVEGLPCVPLVDGPRWSPDGSRIALVTGRPDRTYHLFVVGGDGRGARQLAEVTDLTGFAWSPDGADLVFISVNAVWRVRADGSGLEKLVERQGAYNTIRYSPDGARVAFTSFDGLWVMNRDGSDLRRLGANTEQVIGAAWSPDGRSLAYSSGGIRVVTLDNADRLLVPGGHSPQWSVDDRIAFVFADRNPTMPDRWRSNIELIDPDGSDRVRLVQDDLSRLGEDPQFSADGDRLVFTSHSGGDSTCPPR